MDRDKWKALEFVSGMYLLLLVYWQLYNLAFLSISSFCLSYVIINISKRFRTHLCFLISWCAAASLHFRIINPLKLFAVKRISLGLLFYMRIFALAIGLWFLGIIILMYLISKYIMYRKLSLFTNFRSKLVLAVVARHYQSFKPNMYCQGSV